MFYNIGPHLAEEYKVTYMNESISGNVGVRAELELLRRANFSNIGKDDLGQML
jgi:hypothetical protein